MLACSDEIPRAARIAESTSFIVAAREALHTLLVLTIELRLVAQKKDLIIQLG